MNKNKKGIEDIVSAMEDSGDISYDLRSRLNTIIGFSDILSEDTQSLSLDQREAVERIRRGSNSLVENFSEALSLTRIGTTLAKEIALSEERVRHNQLMLKALWAAMALMIGWSFASHQFAIESATNAAISKIEVVEFKLDALDQGVYRHLSSNQHE